MLLFEEKNILLIKDIFKSLIKKLSKGKLVFFCNLWTVNEYIIVKKENKKMVKSWNIW